MSLELTWLKGQDSKKQYNAKGSPRRKKKINQPTKKTYNVSSPKLGVQTLPNLTGLISIKMTGFGGRWARFRKETHTGNTKQDNWTTHISLSEEGGTTSFLKLWLMAGKTITGTSLRS